MESPLIEADAESIDELFDKDPLKLSDQNVDSIVQEMRASRTNWMAEEQASKTKGKSKKIDLSVGLDDLQLDL